MISKIVLSVALLGVLFSFLVSSRHPRIVGIIVMLATASGLFFVWQPDRTTDIAALVGIGRGADLVFYSWLVISYALILNLQIKLRANLDLVTQLAREIAIQNAVTPKAGA